VDICCIFKKYIIRCRQQVYIEQYTEHMLFVVINRAGKSRMVPYRLYIILPVSFMIRSPTTQTRCELFHIRTWLPQSKHLWYVLYVST